MTTPPARPHTLTDTQRRRTHQAAALLLAYPDERLAARLPLLDEVAATLPAVVGRPLGRMLDHVHATPLLQLAAAYVDTFDLRRRCCLYLTYATCGDTRKRGAALVRFKQTYTAAGLELSGDELPDHLAVVLELSGAGELRRAEGLLREYRAGLELLWFALRDQGSPYADVVGAVRVTLPDPGVRDREAALRLAREGPPDEDVGLEPYGPLVDHPAGHPPAHLAGHLGGRR